MTITITDNRTTTVRQVAAEYDALQDVDSNLDTIGAWLDLAAFNRDAVVALCSGRYGTPEVRVEVVSGQPYETAAEQWADVQQGRFQVSRDYCNHPLWFEGENIAYRVVHDLVGHSPMQGLGTVPRFDLGGELQAWGQQRQFMVKHGASNAAIAAAFTETVGQVCSAVVNGGFGPQRVGILPSFNAHRIINDCGVRS